MNLPRLLERCASRFVQLLGADRILIFTHCSLIKWVIFFLIAVLFILPYRALSFANPIPPTVIYSSSPWKQSSNKKQTQ